MKICENSFCGFNKPVQSVSVTKELADKQLWRDILAYWILGLCSEFGYVVIICAAQDILNRFNSSRLEPDDKKSTVLTNACDTSSDFQEICDMPSTGVLLVADIVPSIVMSFICPFMPLMKNYRMAMVILLNILSFMLIANAEVQYLAIIGVVCTSLALGMGEVTLLSYSSYFDRKVITAWSSGTGAAGIIGSFTYAGLVGLGFKPSVCLRILLAVPIVEAFTFWILLRSPDRKVVNNDLRITDIVTIELDHFSENQEKPNESNSCHPALPKIKVKCNGIKTKLNYLPPLLSYICPLVLVFVFEYISVSGLFEMIYIRDTWLDHESQYRWFQFVYQFGVFTSRSIGTWLPLPGIWWAPFFQIINTFYFMFEAIKPHNPSILIIFGFVFWVGAIGGLSYIQTFHRLIKQLPPVQHKFSLGMLTTAESVGIGIGGIIAIPIHSILCRKLKS